MKIYKIEYQKITSLRVNVYAGSAAESERVFHKMKDDEAQLDSASEKYAADRFILISKTSK